MNQSNNSTQVFLKNLIFATIFSLLSFAVFFVLISFLLFKIPNFEDYCKLFPIALLVCESVFIAGFCRRYKRCGLIIGLLSSVIVSLISLLAGFAMPGGLSSFQRVITMHMLFVVFTAFLQIVFNRKKTKKRKNPFPLTK